MYNSIVIRSLKAIWDIITIGYEYSFLNRIIRLIKKKTFFIFENSKFIRFFTSDRFLLEESFLYTIFSNLIDIINRLTTNIRSWIKKNASTSFTYKLFTNENIKLKNFFVFLLGLGMVFSLLYYNTAPSNYYFAGVGLLVALITLFDTKKGIFAEVFLYPFLPDIINIFLMIFILAVYLLKLLFKKTKLIFKHSIVIPIILYVVLIIINTITSIDPMGSFRDLAIHLSAIGFIFVLINSIDSKKDFNMLIVIFVLSATLISIYGIYQFVADTIEMDRGWVDIATNKDIRTRVYSVFGNPNILAEYLIMIIPIPLSLFLLSDKRYKKLTFLSISLILTLALIMTMSRGGWLGFAFGIFVFLLFIEKRLLLLAIPLGIVVMSFLPSSVINRFFTIFDLTDTSNNYRIRLWDLVLKLTRDNRLVGFGFGHLPFKSVIDQHIKSIAPYHSHNTVLQTIAEMGIVGLIIFMSLVFILFKYAIKKLAKGEDKYIRIMSIGILSGLSALLIHGLVENILYMPRIITTFWLLVGLIVTLVKINKPPQNPAK